MEIEELKKVIRGCLRGDRKSQRALFESYNRAMLGVCLRYTKDKDSAQEVLQEGFIKVFEKLEDFDFCGSFEGWVRRIMVNTAIDAIRKKNRGAISTDEEFILETNELYDHDDDVDKELINLKAEVALEAVQSLSDAYRTAFNLYVIENLSHKEIAEILGISEGTSKSNLAKAKQNLRALLKDKFDKLDNR